MSANSIAVNAISVSGHTVSLLLDDRLIESRDQGQSWSAKLVFPGPMGMALYVEPPWVLVGLADGGVLVKDTRTLRGEA